MRGPRAWLLLAGLTLTLATTQEYEACTDTGYFDGGNPCAASSPGTVCPPGCMEFLKELPPVCRSTLANMLTHQAAHMLDSRCGTDVGLSGSMVPGAPKASPARTPIVIPRLTYQPSKECSDRYDDGMIKYIYDTSRFCNKYTERVGCLKQCAAYLKISILPECAQTVFLHPRYGSDIAGWYVRRCHLPLPDDDSPSPSPGTPPQGLAPPLPVELSPSPSPSPTSQLPPEVLPPLDSPAPAPAASGLLVRI